MEHEITSQAIHLAAQTDLLDRFRNDLRHITREIDEPIAALKKIKEKLKELPCKSIDWTKFEAQFNQVHPEFKAKLAEKYPELTQMEQRIAAMVRMDLNSATIARLFCVTERAVEFHRLNLRKKLGLKEGEKLPKFLSML
jgi:DNA-binding NarL/FixJ family response regulator